MTAFKILPGENPDWLDLAKKDEWRSFMEDLDNAKQAFECSQELLQSNKDFTVAAVMLFVCLGTTWIYWQGAGGFFLWLLLMGVWGYEIGSLGRSIINRVEAGKAFTDMRMNFLRDARCSLFRDLHLDVAKWNEEVLIAHQIGFQVSLGLMSEDVAAHMWEKVEFRKAELDRRLKNGFLQFVIGGRLGEWKKPILPTLHLLLSQYLPDDFVPESYITNLSVIEAQPKPDPERED